MNRSLREPKRGHLGNLRMQDSKDEDLALFRELRNREKEHDDLLLLNSDDFDDTYGPKTGGSQIFNITPARVASSLVLKSVADDFFNSDNDRNDYDWLLTPPGTPLFTSLETESQTFFSGKLGSSKSHSTSLKSRLSNPPERAKSSLPSRQSTSFPVLNTSSDGILWPSSSPGSGSRPSTPPGVPTLSSTSQSVFTQASNKPSKITASKQSSTSSKVASATSKPSGSTTPTNRTKFPSAKPIVNPRSSTPNAKSAVRSLTPTSRTAIPAKSMPRTLTPTRRTTAERTPTASIKSPNTSVGNQASTMVKNQVPRLSNSFNVKPKPWKPSEVPGFSLDALPNLKTSLPNRAPSASRGRPGASNARSQSVEPVSNERTKRLSCSPSRSRPPNGFIRKSGSSVPVPTVSRLQAKASENVSPVLIGTKMVERVINMRKLVPPKLDNQHSPHSNASGKSSSPDSLGIGRTISKKSLDMAIRHMDIRHKVPGNPRSHPTSSTHSARPALNRSRTVSASNSSLATSSNASSVISE